MLTRRNSKFTHSQLCAPFPFFRLFEIGPFSVAVLFYLFMFTFVYTFEVLDHKQKMKGIENAWSEHNYIFLSWNKTIKMMDKRKNLGTKS